MKTIRFILTIGACAICAQMNFTNIHASEQANETERLIEEAKNEYFNEVGVYNTESLTYEQQVELIERINVIKNADPELVALKNEENSRATSQFKGRIWVTGDSKTFNIPHGHAGIGSATPYAFVEANPNDGVALYPDRIRNYWAHVNSSVLKVRGATDTDYTNAANYAVWQIGKPYSINIFDGESAFFCSELVTRAWEYAGIDVGDYLAFPVDLLTHSNTIVINTYGSGF